MKSHCKSSVSQCTWYFRVTFDINWKLKNTSTYNLGQEGWETQDIHYFYPMDIKTKISELWKTGKGKRIALKQQQFCLSAPDMMTMIIFWHKVCTYIGIRYIIHCRNKNLSFILKTVSNNTLWCFCGFVLWKTENNNTCLAFTPFSFIGRLDHIPFTYFFFRLIDISLYKRCSTFLPFSVLYLTSVVYLLKRTVQEILSSQRVNLCCSLFWSLSQQILWFFSVSVSGTQ